MTKVVIETAGPNITVEADEHLTNVIDKALALYKELLALCPPPDPWKRETGPTGFTQTETSWRAVADRTDKDHSFVEPGAYTPTR